MQSVECGARNAEGIGGYPTKVVGPQLWFLLYRREIHLNRKSSALYRTKVAAYLIWFVLDRTEKGSYLFRFHAYLIGLGSPRFSSDKEETEKGKLQNEIRSFRILASSCGNLVPQASDEKGKTG